MTYITPPDPAAAFRLQLLMDLLPYAGTADPVELAERAEAFIWGGRIATEPPITTTPQDEHHDEAAEAPPAAGRDAEGTEGDQPAEGDDLQRGAVAGNGGDDGAGEPSDAPPAEGAGQEGGETLLTTIPGITIWTPERRKTLADLCGEGLSAKEIAARMDLANAQLVHGNASRFGLTAMWREARERRAQQAATPSVLSEPEAAAEIDVVVTRKQSADVDLPPTAVSFKPSANDLAAAALVVDKPGRDGPIMVARDIPQGESLAFRKHRTLAEVGILETAPEPAPAPPPLPSVDERQRMIEAHIAKKGLTTTEPDFGPDQPAIDVLRNACNSLVPAKPHVGPGRPRPWILNGTPITTERLWQSANVELKSQSKRPIKRQA